MALHLDVVFSPPPREIETRSVQAVSLLRELLPFVLVKYGLELQLAPGMDSTPGEGVREGGADAPPARRRRA